MLFRIDLAGGQCLVPVNPRQNAAVILLVGLAGIAGGIPALLIDGPIAVKNNDAATGTHGDVAGPVADIDTCLIKFCGLHLAGDGPLPDQVIEARLIMVEIAAHRVWRAFRVSRADCFMRFLRICGSCAIGPRCGWQIIVAEPLADFIAHRGNSFAAKLHAICPHIGDQAGGFRPDIDPFIQLLGHLHGAAGRKAKLARGFLLQR